MLPSPSTKRFSTLVELLEHRAAEQPDQLLYTFLDEAESAAPATMTYGELDRRARRIGASLQALAARGERVVLLYPPGLEYIAGFFGALYAGLIAVPAYPPDPTRLERTLPRLRAIIEDAGATMVLTTSFIRSMADFLFEQAPDLTRLRWVATDALPEDAESAWERPRVDAGSPAFLQYTSGSTGAPKGVMVGHDNLLHNVELIAHAFRVRPGSVGVIWLPPYHDMGLIGGILEPLAAELPTVLLSPLAFLKRPLRWLEAVSRHRATISGGPNFAFDLCVRKSTPEERSALDLSSWEVAFCGAEPVRPETLDRFAEAFAPAGFRRGAFYPCYGLAEGTLIVSGGQAGEEPILCTLDAAALEQNRVEASPPGAAPPAARTLVGCGRALLDQEMLVVDPGSLTLCPPGAVGEIWVRGPSVAKGYWQKPDETAEAFHAHLAGGEGPYLRTGDLGFLREGQLFVTGRSKDIIILRGRNHYPQDLEATIGACHPAVRAGCTAAFSVEAGGEERLVVVQEVDLRKGADLDEVAATIRREVARSHEIELHAVALLAPGAIHKTTSGKIQRRACKAAFAEGRLGAEKVVLFGGSDRKLEDYLLAQLTDLLRAPRGELDLEQRLSSLGVDSLTAIELKSRIERDLGVAVPVGRLLAGASLRELTAEVTAYPRATAATAPAIVVGGHRADGLGPLSYGQSALWFLQQLAPESGAYNVVSAVRVVSRLDVGRFEQALALTMARHPALRTTYEHHAGEVQQRVHERADAPLTITDASAWSDEELRQRLADEAAHPFDLARGPVLRARLFSRPDGGFVLLLVVHHIAIDLASFVIVVEELAALYGSLEAGAPIALPPLTLAYADFVRWQASHLASPEGERLWAYWRDQLGGELPALDLPLDRPRPPVQTYRGSSHAFALDHALTGRIEALARAEGTTLYTVLLAVFQVLLHRLSGQDEILVGSSTAGRSRSELEPLVGYFVNPVVVRASFAGRPTFREALGQIGRAVLGALEHADYPFPLLVERLQGARDPSRSPLFQAMFVLLRSPRVAGVAPFALGEAGASLALGGLEVQSVALPARTALFDVSLMMAESRGVLAGSIEYNADLFDAASIARMAGYFQALLEGVVASPALPVDALPLLGEAERHQLLIAWNDTAAAFPGEACVHQLFEAQAESTPEAIAVVLEGESLSYRELNERSNQLAHYLRKVGVKPDTLVGLCMDRSLELVVGILGILKAGGAYVPLDPTHPPERLSFLLVDTGISVLLTQEALVDELPDYRFFTLCVDSDWARVARQPRVAPASAVTPSSLAYVIYTSGSTGRPKGVLVEHRSLVNLALEQGRRFEVRESTRVLQFARMGFDVAVGEVFTALLHGGTLVLAPQASLLPGPDLARVLDEERIELLMLTPSALAAQPAGAHPSLRTLVVGGEACAAELVEQWAPGRRLISIYGPTEATVASTLTAWEAGRGKPPIGRPMANTRAYVLDAQREPAPLGVAGELYLGGVGIARGYLNQPELTAARFVADPFVEGGRLYRTGDMARWRSDGELEFLGRNDDQVKIRGFRIELGEIEAALGRAPSVQTCVVAAREDVPGDRRLVAYVVLEAGSALSVAELREHLQETLPAYMVPAAFVALEALPLLPSGKVARHALPAPTTSTRDLGDGYQAPRTPVEELLAAIFAGVLGLARAVGINEDFFTLGGHSLLATQVISRIRSTLGIELPLRHLFEAPTAASLGARAEAARRAGAGLAAPSITPAPREGDLPLSFAQQRLWFLDQLAPGGASYNMPGALRLAGALDAAALGRVFGEIARRHEALRTTFTSLQGRAVQVIHAAPAIWDLPVVDLASLPEPAREAEASRRAAEEASRPFDLSTGPLLRTTLLRLGVDDHVLLVTMHHIVSDGWSIGVLVREVAALYAAFREGEPSPLPELSIQYADFAAWQRGWLAGEALDLQLAYWKERLRGAPTLDLVTDRPRPPVQTHRGGSSPVMLPADLVTGLLRVSRARGATLFMTLMAAFQVLLARWSGQSDVSVGTPVANRNRGEIEPLIGFFINTLVLRSDLADAPRFVDLLDRVRESALGAYAHQDVPFERVLESLGIERDLGRTPLFQVMLVLQNTPAGALDLPGLRFAPMPVELETSKYELTLSLSEEAGRLGGSFTYNADLFDAATIARMAASFEVLLRGVVADPECAVDALPILGPDEAARIASFNRTERGWPVEHTVHALFAEQARRTPDRDAVVFGAQRLTYAELSERAGRLAGHLRALGVRAEARVGLCLERGVELLVGVLGVLQAGAAYVPIDPTAPRERIADMLAQAEVGVVVTQESRRALVSVASLASLRVISLDGDAEAIAAAPHATAPAGEVRPDHLAYVIFTSGSTGKPKGVMIEHRSVVNLAAALREAVYGGLGDGLRVSLSAPLAFDASVKQWVQLLAGHTLCVVPDEARPDAAQLCEVVRRHRLDVLDCTPSQLAGLLERGLGHDPEVSPALVLIGGEAIDQATWSALAAAPHTSFVNVYGPTECTVDATSCIVRRSPTPTIGRPLGNVQVHVLDEARRPVPIGVVGELCIGGAGVGRGYCASPSLTAERFVLDPDPTVAPGTRLYRTGDRARFRPDGLVELLGRADGQVKLRGFRIELGEIEAVLSRHPDVRACAVLVREDAPDDRRLVAYVVPHATAATAPALREHLQQSLPAYMVPSAFVPMAALPLSPNGKLDRRALPPPEAILDGARGSFVAPRSRAELDLAVIFEDLLGVRPVGVRDDFFTLGGHSLLAVRLLARIEARFGRALPLSQLFRGATIEALAGALLDTTIRREESLLVSLRASGDRPPFFCVHAVGGSALAYRELALHLGEDQPFHALHARGVDGDEEPIASVEIMARLYLDAVRRVQPHGPYHLGGWSFGGLVAFEMARQLLAEGETVAVLALLDAWAPKSAPEPPADDLYRVVLIARELGLPVDVEALIPLTPEERVAHIAELATRSGLLPPGVGEAHVRRLLRVNAAHLEARRRYTPGPYAGRVTLLRVEDPPHLAEALGDPTRGWAALAAAPVDVHVVPGDHFSMVRDPHVRALAEALRRVLAHSAPSGS